MTSDFARSSTMHLNDNEILFFYRLIGIDLSSGPNLRLGDLVQGSSSDMQSSSDILSAEQIEALRTRYADTSVWGRLGAEDTNLKDWNFSPDLTPSLRAVLSDKADRFTSRWGLTPSALRLATGEGLYLPDVPPEARAKKQIIVNLRKAGKRRLVAAGVSVGAIRLKIEDLSIVAFATSLSFAVTRVSAHRLDDTALSCAELSEVVAALSHVHECHWVATAQPETRIGPKFTLGSFIRLLSEGRADKETPKRRAFTYTLARLGRHVESEQLDLLGSYLSRRYTSAYALDPTSEAVHVVGTFKNNRHYISTEGVATIICPLDDQPLPEFLENWGRNVFLAAYARVLVLALHEDWFLTIGRSSALGGPTIDNDDEEERRVQMAAIIDQSLTFRLCFRFTSYSGISMHNQFGDSLRKTFALDQKLSEMGGDVHAIAERLEIAQCADMERRAQQRVRLYSIISIFGIAPIAGLTTYSIVVEVLKVFPNLTSSIVKTFHGSDSMASSHIAFYSGCLVAAITFVATISTGLPAAVKRRPSQRLSITAMKDHVRKKVLDYNDRL